ncbi:MAG: HAMP domain-containing histidine kinase [Acidimicrobiia bacterium]|nr:HAMP domain-containing histidine kinase [Acidimicrobiia bacterium]
MAERLEELVGSQRAFVADASHQLRTPLTALRLRLENLESTAPAAASADLEAGTREVARLGRLVEGLLAIARAEGMRPERRPVDAATVARERVEAWAPLAEERGLHLTLDAEHDAPALAVEGALDQVLDNLLDNAMEATPEGGTITVTVDTDEDEVTVHVIDDGPGMSDDERSRAFDRFWRGAAGDTAGSGLGLAIVRQLVSASGGRVELHDADPTGLDVDVRLLATSISAPLTADG